jgi:hypothetical protein
MMEYFENGIYKTIIFTGCDCLCPVVQLLFRMVVDGVFFKMMVQKNVN